MTVYATENSGTVSGTVSGLLELIEQNPGRRKPFFEDILQVPARSLQRWLSQLQDDGKIEFRGAPKTGGYWMVDKE